MELPLEIPSQGGSQLPESEARRFLQQRELWFPCGAYRMRYLRLPAVEPPLHALPALVFVHGLMGYSFSWRHNLEFFAQHRDVYAIDLLGVGHSDRPAPGSVDYGMGAAASRLTDFLRSLGQSHIDLVGTSHGGAVAMLAASQDRASSTPLIRSLVLVAPANPFMTNARLRIALFRTSFGRMLLRNLAARSRLLRRKSVGRMYAHAARITEETRSGYDVNLADRRSYEYALEVVRTWREDMQQLKAALASIADIPTLLLWGERDQAVSCKSGLLLQKVFSNAQYVVLPDVGHLPYEEAPEEFNRIVLRFLES
jgi:pimeloyl-ACP methyl ester carboxylesterase